MIDYPRYFSYIPVQLSAPAGEQAQVTYEIQQGNVGTPDVDYELSSGTVIFSPGGTVAWAGVTTRHPFLGDAFDVKVILRDAVNCIVDEPEKYFTFPGKVPHRLFYDAGSDVDGIPIIGRSVEYSDRTWYQAKPATPGPEGVMGNGMMLIQAAAGERPYLGQRCKIHAVAFGGTVGIKMQLDDPSLLDEQVDAFFGFHFFKELTHGGFQLHFNRNQVSLTGDDLSEEAFSYDWAAAQWPMQVEMRWDFDVGVRALYLNDTLVASTAAWLIPEDLYIADFYLTTNGVTSIGVKELEITQVGPAPEELSNDYFNGSIVSPASNSAMVISGPGNRADVPYSGSVSGNAYDRTGNALISLDFSSFDLQAIRVECTYRPQVGQRSYGPNAGGDATGATVRSQYSSIRAVFDKGAAPEASLQAPMNDIIDSLYAQDAPLPLAPFQLVYEINTQDLRYSVNGGAFVIVPHEGTTNKLSALHLTAWVSAIRFEMDDTYYEGPYCLSDIVVKDGTPPAPELTWYAKGSDWTSYNAVPPTGSEDGWYPGNWIVGRYTGSLLGDVAWTAEWRPVDSGNSNSPTNYAPRGPNPDDLGAGAANWDKGVAVDPMGLFGGTLGEYRLKCTVDDVPVPGYLWLTWAAGPQTYATMAWGYSDVPEA